MKKTNIWWDYLSANPAAKGDGESCAKQRNTRTYVETTFSYVWESRWSSPSSVRRTCCLLFQPFLLFFHAQRHACMQHAHVHTTEYVWWMQQSSALTGHYAWSTQCTRQRGQLIMVTVNGWMCLIGSGMGLGFGIFVSCTAVTPQTLN